MVITMRINQEVNMSTKTDELCRAYSYGMISSDQLVEKLKALAEWLDLKKELSRETC